MSSSSYCSVRLGRSARAWQERDNHKMSTSVHFYKPSARKMRGSCWETPEDAMIERQLEIPTKDGQATTFIVHPDRGGPRPVIVFLMDAPGIREELRDMARRLATVGYYVM